MNNLICSLSHFMCFLLTYAIRAGGKQEKERTICLTVTYHLEVSEKD